METNEFDQEPVSGAEEQGENSVNDEVPEEPLNNDEEPSEGNATQPGINNSGDNPAFFEENEIDEVNLNNAGRDIVNNYFTNYNKSVKEKKFSCPNCGEPIEVKRFGRQVCKNPKCKKDFIIKNGDQEDNILLYKTLLPDEAKKYDKIIAQINNSLIDRDYVSANEFCQKAEELAPGEVATWVYFALAEFLLEIKRKEGRKPVANIIRSVRLHIEKCKIHGMTPEECIPLEKDIAMKLYNIEKSRINSLPVKLRDSLGVPKWSPFNFKYLQALLESYDICYSLHKDSIFLEGYIEELSKPFKWVFRNWEGKLSNNPASGLNAEKKLLSLVEKIKNKNPDYQPPMIAEERFMVRNVLYLKINAVTAKTA